MTFEHNGFWEMEAQDESDRREANPINHIRVLHKVMEPENEICVEEVRKRAIAQKEARKKERSEDILKWRDLPEEIFKIAEIKELEGGKYGPSRILTLEGVERKGERIKVWACKRMIKEMDMIPRKGWPRLQLVNDGMKKAKKSGYEYFDFEVMVGK